MQRWSGQVATASSMSAKTGPVGITASQFRPGGYDASQMWGRPVGLGSRGAGGAARHNPTMPRRLGINQSAIIFLPCPAFIKPLPRCRHMFSCNLKWAGAERDMVALHQVEDIRLGTAGRGTAKLD